MAKKPDYAKATREASAALTDMKIKGGALHGLCLGSGDRAAAIERLRRWCDLAAQYLSTEMIDQMALRIKMYLVLEAMQLGDEAAADQWYDRWAAELAEDKREHGPVQ